MPRNIGPPTRVGFCGQEFNALDHNFGTSDDVEAFSDSITITPTADRTPRKSQEASRPYFRLACLHLAQQVGGRYEDTTPAQRKIQELENPKVVPVACHDAVEQPLCRNKEGWQAMDTRKSHEGINRELTAPDVPED